MQQRLPAAPSATWFGTVAFFAPCDSCCPVICVLCTLPLPGGGAHRSGMGSSLVSRCAVAKLTGLDSSQEIISSSDDEDASGSEDDNDAGGNVAESSGEEDSGDEDAASLHSGDIDSGVESDGYGAQGLSWEAVLASVQVDSSCAEELSASVDPQPSMLLAPSMHVLM